MTRRKPMRHGVFAWPTTRPDVTPDIESEAELLGQAAVGPDEQVVYLEVSAGIPRTGQEGSMVFGTAIR